MWLRHSGRMSRPHHRSKSVGLLIAAGLVAALSAGTLTTAVVSTASAEPGLPPSSHRNFHFTRSTITFDADFPGGKLDELVEVDEKTFDLLIRPETEPINDSAWYAFKVSAKRPQMIDVRLCYQGGSHRYEPKVSRDRQNWSSARHLVVARHPGGREITLRLAVGPEPTWIAGQELYGDQDVRQWMQKRTEHPHVSSSSIGRSVKGLPLRKLEIADGEPTDAIFILSRQHPPEVTGTIGMMSFVDAITCDGESSNAFRKSFRTVVVPIANPDGVRQGNWRTNANGIDLNRDWMHFTQPETLAIRDEMLRLRNAGRLWLFLDFHSTYNEVFYTPPRETKLFPDGFTTRWLDAVDRRVTDFHVIRDDAHNAHRSTSKAWVARELGIHAVTYEFGDETPRPKIHRIAKESADEMMKLLIRTKREISHRGKPL